MSDPDIEAIVDELFTATAPASLQTSGCRFVPTHRVPAGPSSETRAGSPTTAEFRDAMSELRVYASRRHHRYANHTARLCCSHPQQRTRYHASCLLSSHACTHEGGGVLKQPCIPTPPSLSCRLTRRPLRSLNFRKKFWTFGSTSTATARPRPARATPIFNKFLHPLRYS